MGFWAAFIGFNGHTIPPRSIAEDSSMDNVERPDTVKDVKIPLPDSKDCKVLSPEFYKANNELLDTIAKLGLEISNGSVRRRMQPLVRSSSNKQS